MKWVRRAFVGLLSLILLCTLLGAVSSYSINAAVGKPDKIETWLSESKLYDHVVESLVQQSVTGQASNSDDISPSDPGVKEALQAALPPEQLEKFVTTFLNANYAWLDGKTAKPIFVIDLTTAKQTFAVQVGKAVEAHLASLPICTTAQLASMTATDPLTATCRPPNLTPAAAGAAATAKLLTDGPFKNTVVTADNFGKNISSGVGAPYYQKATFAPDAYKWGVKAPWILAGIALVAAIGVVLLSSSKRKGARRVGTIFLEVAALLIATKFIADWAFGKVTDRAFNATNVGPIQESLTDFLHRFEMQLTHTNLYAGIVLAILGIILIIVYIVTKGKRKKSTSSPEADTDLQLLDDPNEPKPSSEPTPQIHGPSPHPTPTAPTLPHGNRPPKKPRLIQ